LGELLVMRGLLSEENIASALAEQRRTKRRLGQILIDRGLISAAALDSTLSEQASGFKPQRGFGAGLRDAVEEQRQQRYERSADGGDRLARSSSARVM
jgi:hypothetical protein